MGFYYFLIFILLIEAVIIFSYGKGSKNKKIYLSLAFCKLMIISAFRSSTIGTDTPSYLRFFQMWGIEKSIFDISTRIEPGYLILNRIVYFFNSNSQSILIVTSLIIMYLYLRFIYKESSMIWLSVYLFITLRYFYSTMNLIRLSLAMGIIFISYKFLKERKTISFVITVILASLFHSTAIVFLIAYPITKGKFNRKKILYIGLLGMLVFVAFNPILEIGLKFFPQYKHYLNSRFFNSNVTANYIQFLIDFLILLFGLIIVLRRNKDLNSKDDIKERSEINILLYLITLGVFFSFISIKASILDRIASYFSVFSIVFIPKIVSMVENKNERIIYTYLIMFFSLLYHTIIFIYRPEWNIVFPYEFFWQR